MSLITRCPDCGTMFKVVPDQLRISEGWVRCGNCAQVFDASAHLQGEASGPVERVAEAVPAESVPVPVVSATDSVSDQEFGLSTSSEIDEGVVAEPDSIQIDAEAQALREHPLDRPFELRRADIAHTSATLSSEFEADSQIESELPDVAFVRQARRQKFWDKPRVRAWMKAGVAALAVLLLAQIAVQDRDRLAAAAPALRPILGVLCLPFNCRIGPQRTIEAIAIESSSFNKLSDEGYRLQVRLRNQGATEVAIPALELTLTDGQDEALVRRVLMARDLGANTGVIPAAGEWSASVSLAMSDDRLTGRIAGYRLLAFYP